MKIMNFATRQDEIPGLEMYSEEFGYDFEVHHESLGPDTVHLAKGFDAVTIIGNCKCNKEVLEELDSYGVRYVLARAAGYNNIDLETAGKLGIRVANVPAYSPSSVSEFVVGLALTLTRNINHALDRAKRQDFSLQGLIGREIQELTVGVVGTGRIGANVVKHFAGFGGRVICNDLYPNEEVKKYGEYVDLDYLLKEADIITLHCPLFEDNYHMINKESIEGMKDDVIIINAARGGLVDTEALLEGLLSGKIKGAALDTYEDEAGIFFVDHSGKILQDEVLARLIGLPNVLVTPHYAFYTETAVRNIIETVFNNIKSLEEGECRNEVRFS